MDEDFPKLLDKLLDKYTIAIQNYLTIGGTSQMKQVADEIGSYFLANGLGVVEITSIHQQALENILPSYDKSQKLIQIIKATTEFLTQILVFIETKKSSHPQHIFDIIKNQNEQSELKNNLHHSNNIKFLDDYSINLANIQKNLIVDLENHSKNQIITNQLNQQILYDWNTQTNQIVWEKYTETILGYPATEMPKKIEDLIGLIYPSQQAAVIEAIKQSLVDKTPILLQYQIRCQNGNYLFIEHKGQFFRDSRGNLCRLMGLLEDISDRKQVEAKIHFQSRLLDSVQQAVVATDLEGKIIYWNYFAELMFGWSSKEVLGRPVNEIISTLSTIKISEMISHIVIGESLSGELLVKRRDNKQLPIMEIDSPIYNQEGNIIGISSIMVDLTERKRIESALRQSEERFKVTIQKSPITVFNQDTNLCYTWIINPPAEFNRQTIVGKNDTDLFTPTDAQNLIAIKQQVLELKKGCRQEISLTINGVIKYYDLNLEPLKNDLEEIIGITGACYDITDRKEAILALQKADSRLRLHVENSPLAVIEFNQEMRVQLWSGQAEKIFGWRSEEVIGKQINELHLIHEADLAEVNQAVKDLLDQNIPRNLCQNRNYTKNGKSVYCQWYNSALVDESGKVVSILSLAEDITAQKQAETERDIFLQQLEAQNQNLESQIKFRTAQLAGELVKRQKTEGTLKNLVEATAPFTGKDFLPALVQHLTSALDVDHALIAGLDNQKLQILAFWSNNQLQPNTSYNISGTPCEVTLNKGIYYCCCGVQKLFPQDPILSRMQAESYLGVTLVDRTGQTIGILCILNHKPLTEIIILQDILQVFATRAVAELEQQQVIEALRNSEKRYGTLIKNFPDGAVILFDANLRYLFADGAGLAEMKLSRELLENQTIWQTWPPEVCQILEPKYQNALKGIAQTFEMPLNNRFYIVKTLPVKNDHGDIFAGMAIFQDITERKQAQAELRDS
ncbi:MAG: PAS domain S-box protein [Microcoleaceae cyanobacterium MO_207.B10]|nr:PAS domain S-box protein [Microcoleaceae cyanobacterium MO_207.B10]